MTCFFFLDTLVAAVVVQLIQDDLDVFAFKFVHSALQ